MLKKIMIVFYVLTFVELSSVNSTNHSRANLKESKEQKENTVKTSSLRFLVKAGDQWMQVPHVVRCITYTTIGIIIGYGGMPVRVEQRGHA